MGWLSLMVLPVVVHTLPFSAMALIVGGGVLYRAGALVYAGQRSNPWPQVFGFHEIFHLFVVAGSGAFLLVIWGWVLPVS